MIQRRTATWAQRLTPWIPFLFILSIILQATNAGSDPDDYKISGKDRDKDSDDPDLDHPCFRPCSSDPSTRMTCGYRFNVAHNYAMNRYCKNCPNVTEDCYLRGCIPVDGRPRSIAVVNERMPGPSIRVCKDDYVIVDVTNLLIAEELTIHWHGIDHIGTPWNDGVPSLTQCSIPHGNTFRYEFKVPDAGTFFWHSHEELQRANGIAGTLIVREDPKVDVHGDLFDFDLPEHELIIWDWMPEYELIEYLVEAVYQNRSKPVNILVNAKGFQLNYFKDFSTQDTIEAREKPFVPIQEFRVKGGKRYRFRVISNGVAGCPVEISIENHDMLMIASDGQDIRPLKVSSFVVNAGERFDFVLNANQQGGSHWMKFRGFLDCGNSSNSVYQVAVINYENRPKGSFPRRPIRSWLDAGPTDDGPQLNPVKPLFDLIGTNEQVINMADVRSMVDDDPELLTRKPDYRFPLSMGFIRHYDPVDCSHAPASLREQCLQLPPQVAMGNVDADASFRMNGITNMMSVPAPLVHPEAYDTINRCNLHSLRSQGINCSTQECVCNHWERVKLGSIVEIILINKPSGLASHPMHLHGMKFRVLSLTPFTNETEINTLDEIKGSLKRVGPKNAAIKDTVWLPLGSQVVIRFRASNPGYWFFHCHFEIHAVLGMSMTFQVGDLHQIPRPPSDFPRCANYTPPVPNIRYGREYRFFR